VGGRFSFFLLFPAREKNEVMGNSSLERSMG
jgi:hypothetical protein